MSRKSSSGRKWTSRRICPSKTRSALILWPRAKSRMSAIACMSLWTPGSTTKNTESQTFSKSWSFANRFTRGTIGIRRASDIKIRKSRSCCPKTASPIRRESSCAMSPRSRSSLRMQMRRTQGSSNSGTRGHPRAEPRNANRKGSGMALLLMSARPAVSSAARWFLSQMRNMHVVTA